MGASFTCCRDDDANHSKDSDVETAIHEATEAGADANLAFTAMVKVGMEETQKIIDAYDRDMRNGNLEILPENHHYENNKQLQLKVREKVFNRIRPIMEKLFKDFDKDISGAIETSEMGT